MKYKAYGAALDDEATEVLSAESRSTSAEFSDDEVEFCIVQSVVLIHSASMISDAGVLVPAADVEVGGSTC